MCAYDIGEARLRNPQEYIELSPTLTQRCGTGGNNTPAVCYPVENNPNDSRNYLVAPVVNRMRGFGDYEQDEKCSAVKARDYKDATDLIVEANISKRRYIIRRLTPLECARLQGFPDWWENGVQGSDSARYKMWGNGIALPNAVYVIGCAKKLIQVKRQGQGHDGLKERM